jgi:hypothetical protein
MTRCAHPGSRPGLPGSARAPRTRLRETRGLVGGPQSYHGRTTLCRWPLSTVTPSVALACKGPLNARLATGVGLSFFLSFFQVAALESDLAAARREAEAAIRESAAAKEGAAHELTLLRKQLSAAKSALADATKVRGRLAPSCPPACRARARACALSLRCADLT